MHQVSVRRDALPVGERPGKVFAKHCRAALLARIRDRAQAIARGLRAADSGLALAFAPRRFICAHTRSRANEKTPSRTAYNGMKFCTSKLHGSTRIAAVTALHRQCRLLEPAITGRARRGFAPALCGGSPAAPNCIAACTTPVGAAAFSCASGAAAICPLQRFLRNEITGNIPPSGVSVKIFLDNATTSL